VREQPEDRLGEDEREVERDADDERAAGAELRVVMAVRVSMSVPMRVFVPMSVPAVIAGRRVRMRAVIVRRRVAFFGTIHHSVK
jgi:hypothetical protein